MFAPVTTWPSTLSIAQPTLKPEYGAYARAAAARARSSNCSSVMILSLTAATGHAPVMPNDKVPSRMHLKVIALLAATAAVLPSPAFAWGKTGHRVVAAIADTQLSGLARAHVEEILGRGESLDEAANWPDEMRSAPGQFWQKTATPWHYVTLNGIIYDHTPAEGDALEALSHYRDVLRDPRATLAEKQTALRFIVHLVGDLHQPLHVGKCCDRGGNEVKVKWFGRDLNLHSVWDSALVDEEQLSFTEMAAKLDRHTSP